MKIEPIKTADDHAGAMNEIRRLMELDPPANSPEAARLEVLATLAEAYEEEKIRWEAADAIDAIKFRMEQAELAPRDLIPLLGGRSKVSEVLARKRPLTITMMRALQDSLGIPASLLLRPAAVIDNPSIEPEAGRFPIKEMIRRGWIQNDTELDSFFSRLSPAAAVALRSPQTQHIRSARKMNLYALQAWISRVTMRAAETNIPRFLKSDFTVRLMQEVVSLSTREDGPRAAQEFLQTRGIPLIIEPHLPQTYLDGAAVLLLDERPVIGMTIRYDRLDNFWFTLMHELAHIVLHFGEGRLQFIDDLDVGAQNDPIEREADSLAGETLIPLGQWNKSPAVQYRSASAALHVAKQLNIHPAIVAGRMRHHWKAFRLLNNLVGHHEVRKCFPETQWPNGL